MLFFKRILTGATPEAGSERRVSARYAVHPQFPVKAVLNVAGRDTMGRLLTTKMGGGWDWPAIPVNLSATGARLQVPPTVEALRNDNCLLKLDIQGYELLIPGRIAHLGEQRNAIIYGVVLDLSNPGTQRAYNQLLDFVALGASLKAGKPMKKDKSGYFFERYDGVPSSYLSIWRSIESKEPEAFEFVLKDCMVRALAGNPGVDCLNSTDAATAKSHPRPGGGNQAAVPMGRLQSRSKHTGRRQDLPDQARGVTCR